MEKPQRSTCLSRGGESFMHVRLEPQMVCRRAQHCSWVGARLLPMAPRSLQIFPSHTGLQGCIACIWCLGIRTHGARLQDRQQGTESLYSITALGLEGQERSWTRDESLGVISPKYAETLTQVCSMKAPGRPEALRSDC